MNLLISLHQYDDIALLILRLAVGTIFFVHGLQKRKMWQAQPSEQTPASMITIMRILSVCEPLGAVAMMFGFLTKIAAVGLIIIMCGAMNMKITKWGRKFTGENGWELDFLILCVCASLILLGAGVYSLDGYLFA